VLRIYISIDGDFIEIRKRGLLRRVTHRFVTARSSFHFFRTHYDDDKAWLTLVVRENDVFYLLYSWKGSGNQRDRFLICSRASRPCSPPISPIAASLPSTVNVCLPLKSFPRRRFIVSCPFAARLDAIGARFAESAEGCNNSVQFALTMCALSIVIGFFFIFRPSRDKGSRSRLQRRTNRDHRSRSVGNSVYSVRVLSVRVLSN
jgi:hypothetical protein